MKKSNLLNIILIFLFGVMTGCSLIFVLSLCNKKKLSDPVVANAVFKANKFITANGQPRQHLATASKCYDCQAELPEDLKYMAGKSRCFDCERDLEFRKSYGNPVLMGSNDVVPQPITAEPTTLFSAL